MVDHYDLSDILFGGLLPLLVFFRVLHERVQEIAYMNLLGVFLKRECACGL